MEIALLNAYTNYVDAHIAKGVLEEQGIACWLQDENTVTIDPILTNAVGGIKLLVKKEELGNAGYILHQLRKEQKASVKCPKCGSHNIELVSTPRKASNWVGAILGFLFTNYAIPVHKVNHCFDCNHEFQAE
jgi:Zn finger protein HypA/HybF involved in hydrogenase expression